MSDFVDILKSVFGFVTYVDYKKDDTTKKVSYTSHSVFSMAKLVANAAVVYLVSRKA